MTVADRPPGVRVPPLAAAAGLGLLHALVDATSLAILYFEVPLERLSIEQIGLLVLLYNCAAFGLQAPLGMLADWLGSYRAMTVAGLLLAATAVAISPAEPWTAGLVVGLANALFHTGAGGAVLRSSPGRATEPGIFIGPGTAGVLIGIQLGPSGLPWQQVAIVALAIAGVAVAIAPSLQRLPAGERRSRAAWLAALCVAALLVSVAARSLVGGAAGGAWSRVSVHWAVALTAATVAGKMLGGLLADRVGWRTLSVASLAALAALVGRTAASGQAAVAGALLVQLTTGITAAALCVALPNRPATAFGLASGTILLGAVPGMAGWPVSGWLLPVVIAAAGALFAGLGLLRQGGRANSAHQGQQTQSAI
ncbi:MAG: hypothetical protein PHU85_05920 [Phycisphaerae bacterium]|nr:hypothetical protein [Phycisphaerae bacterium]